MNRNEKRRWSRILAMILVFAMVFCDPSMSYAAEVLSKFPRTMKKADRAAAGKEALWKAFHIKDRKFPRWAQEADWPMGKNSPMEYLGQRRDGELVELRFRDVDTGEERTVEQYY